MLSPWSNLSPDTLAKSRKRTFGTSKHALCLREGRESVRGQFETSWQPIEILKADVRLTASVAQRFTSYSRLVELSGDMVSARMRRQSGLSGPLCARTSRSRANQSGRGLLKAFDHISLRRRGLMFNRHGVVMHFVELKLRAQTGNLVRQKTHLLVISQTFRFA